MKNNAWLSYLIGVVLLAGCRANSQDDGRSTSEQVIPVTRLITRDTVLVREYVSDIEAVQNVEIRARVQGFLEEIFVDEGAEVKKGQALFRINPQEFRLDVAKANANVKSALAEVKTAELEVSRIRAMVDKGVITSTELDVVNARLDAANARLEEARSAHTNALLRLSYTDIRSPFDGVIDRIPLKVGSLVDEGALLTSVSNIQEVYAYFNVSENEYLAHVKSQLADTEPANQVVDLILSDGSRYAHTGTIETMEGEFDESTGSIAFRARFPNPEKLLKHRATGSVRLANTIKNALFVPQKSVSEVQDKNFVLVLDSTNTVRMQNFISKARLSHFYIVDTGLQSGETIVYEGIQSIRDGAQISPRMVSMDSLLIAIP